MTEGWPAEARAVLERAFRAFGGEPQWRDAPGFRLEGTSAGGALLRFKGLGQTFWFPPRILMWPSRGVATFEDYPRPGEKGTFDNGAVSLFDAAGRRYAHSQHHRATFHGLSKLRLWSALDALYFFGYATVHYYSLPFSLQRARFVGYRRAGALEALTVEYPPGAQTHCERETVYFGADGLIVRHDYTAEIIGSWAGGAHFWSHYARAGSMPIACMRRVSPRVGQSYLPITVLHARTRTPALERA
jgi:hypothetical protein